MKRPRALITQIHNEEFFFPIFLRYYSQFFDPEDIFCIHLLKPKEVDFDRWLSPQPGFVRIPTPDVQHCDFQAVVDRVCSLQRQLLERYEIVMFAEVDEFVAHPSGLATFINEWRGKVAVCKGYEVVHNINEEPPLDLSRKLMNQRHWWYHCHLYDKALITRIPLTYSHGFHHTLGQIPWQPTDPNLLLLHLHKIDYDQCVKRKIERMKNEVDSELCKLHEYGSPGWQHYISEFDMKSWWDLSLDDGNPVEKTLIPEHIRNIPL